ncbi:MAG: hypothetical protein ACOYWZ_13575 [Bacillota bacterium]
MKIALKTFNEEQFDRGLADKNVDILYIGSEFCYHKIGNTEANIVRIKRARDANKKVYLALPIIQQSHIEGTADLIDGVLGCGEEVTFVINDLGLIYYLGEKYGDKDYKVYLGRLLNKNIESCPWHKHIIRNESEFIKKAMFTNSANSMVLVDYLKRFKVEGIEANITEEQNESLKELKNYGYELVMNYDYTYITSGRICPTAYYFKQKNPLCNELCNTHLSLELSQIKDVFSLKEDYYKNVETSKWYGEMKVYGNAVFKENEVCNLEIYKNLYDVIVFDSRKYDGENWGNLSYNFELVKSWRQEVEA